MSNLSKERILIVDHNRSMHAYFRKTLLPLSTSPSETHPASSLHLSFAADEKIAIKIIKQSILDQHPYSLIFIDIPFPPKGEGIKTVNKIWKIDSNVQIVIYTSQPDYWWEHLSTRMDKADQFLILKKPIDIVEIRQLASAFIKKCELKKETQHKVECLETLVNKRTEELKKTSEALLRQGSYDYLTGLPNRILLSTYLKQAILKNKDQGTCLGILFLDIDNFKKINDGLNSPIGDAILKETAYRLQKLIGKNDLLSRVGSDEFVIITTQPHSDYILSLAYHLSQKLSEPYYIENHFLTLTFSIGISFSPQHGNEANMLLQNASSALSAAKEKGPNTCQIYRCEFNQRILQHVELEQALAHAMDRHELILYYQPILEIVTNKIFSVEALLRWQHPTMGLISPLSILSIAEKMGLIVPINNWVIRQACLHTKNWLEKGIPDLRIAINIAGQAFKKDNFVETVENILNETQIDTNLVEFEFNEGLFHINDHDEIRKKMFELKNLGIHLVLDNFGTGYVSLTHLKKLPFEKVKIDKSFVRSISESNEDAKVIEAIIAMIKKLDLIVVAEGVETYGQLNFLRLHASDQIQGYLFHHPLDEKHCFELLQEKALLKV